MSPGIPTTFQGKAMTRSSWPRQREPSGIFMGFLFCFTLFQLFFFRLICLLPVCFDFVFEFFAAFYSFVFLFSESWVKREVERIWEE